MSARTRGVSEGAVTACGVARLGSQTRLGRRGPSPATPSGSYHIGDQPDVLGVGAAAGPDDAAPGVEQRGVVTRHRPGPDLLAHRFPRRYWHPRVWGPAQRDVRDLPDLAA